MDGLMFDTEDLFQEVECKIAEKRGKKFTPAIKNKMMGRKIADAIRIMKEELGLDEDPHVLFQEFDLLYQAALRNEVQPRPGLFPLLDFLEKYSVRKAIATSSRKRWVDMTLTKFDLFSRFQVIVTGDDIEKGKPDPEIYENAVSALGLSPERCLVLEDAVNGVEAAKGAGCFVVAIPNEYTKGQDFSKADFITDTLESPELLRRIHPVS